MTARLLQFAPHRSQKKKRRLLARTPACSLMLLGLILVWESSTRSFAQQETPAAESASDTPVITAVRVGFSGKYKLGYWTPVEIDITAGSTAQSAEVQLILPDSDGIPTRVTSGPVSLIPGRTSTARMFARFGQVDGNLLGKLLVEGEEVDEQIWQPGQIDGTGFPQALPATDRLIVTLGKNLAISSGIRIELNEIHFAHLENIEALPSRWYGYEGVNELILVTSEAANFQGLNQNNRSNALLEWVRLGGKVLMTAGRSAPELFAPDTALAKLAPGEFAELLEMRQLTQIEAYANASQRADDSDGTSIQVALFNNIQGRIEAEDELAGETVPLVVRSAYALGEVTLVTFDLDRPPFSTWKERGLLFAQLLNLPTTRPAGEDDYEDLYSLKSLGYNDLTGQLRSALFEFKGISFVSFFVVGWLIFGYLILIGPVDYLIVRRWLKKPELTWVTFPLTVITVSAIAYFAAYHLKGTALKANQVEIVDMDLSTDTVRGTIWTSLFSPGSEPYDLSVQTNIPAEAGSTPDSKTDQAKTLLAWLGLPGEALGGMNRLGTGDTLPLNEPYDFSTDLSELEKMPIQVWSTKSLTARWQAEAPTPIACNLQEEADGLLRGEITNELDIDLKNARLFYDRWVYQIPTLSAGSTLIVGQDVKPVTSRTLLTQLRIVAAQEISAAYDSQSKDVSRILEMIMFHDLSGGDQYTANLKNRYQGFVDLSGHAKLHRAVLVARVPAEGSKLLRSGKSITIDEDHHWVYYRFILPVAPPGTASGR